MFGAGASRGSQGDRCNGPLAPLINELFERRYEQYAHEAGLSDATLETVTLGIRGADNDLERWLTEEWDSSHRLGPQSQRAKEVLFSRIAFYLWRLLSGVSLSCCRFQGHHI